MAQQTNRRATIAATVRTVDELTIATDGSQTACKALKYADAGTMWVGRRVKVQVENPFTPIVEGGL